MDETDPAAHASTLNGLARRWWQSGWARAPWRSLLVVLIALVPVHRHRSGLHSPTRACTRSRSRPSTQGSWTLVPPSAAVDPDLEFPPWRRDRRRRRDGALARHPAYPLLSAGARHDQGRYRAGRSLVTGFGGVSPRRRRRGSSAGSYGRAPSDSRSGLTALVPLLLARIHPLGPRALGRRDDVGGRVPRSVQSALARCWLVRAGSRWPSACCCGPSRSCSLAGSSRAVGVAPSSRRCATSLVGAIGCRRLAVAVVMLVAVPCSSGIASRQIRCRRPRSESAARGAAGAGVPSTRPDGRLRADAARRRQLSSDSRGRAPARALVLVRRWRRAGTPWAVDSSSSRSLALGLGLLVVRVVASSRRSDPRACSSPGRYRHCVRGRVGLAEAVRSPPRASCWIVAATGRRRSAITATPVRRPGVNWGGRFFMPVVPFLGVFAAARGAPTWPDRPPDLERRLLGRWPPCSRASATCSRFAGSGRPTRRSPTRCASQQAPLAMTPIRFDSARAVERRPGVDAGSRLDDFDEALDLRRGGHRTSVVVAVARGCRSRWTRCGRSSRGGRPRHVEPQLASTASRPAETNARSLRERVTPV